MPAKKGIHPAYREKSEIVPKHRIEPDVAPAAKKGRSASEAFDGFDNSNLSMKDMIDLKSEKERDTLSSQAAEMTAKYKKKQ